jgi:hypothetical protein
MIRNPTQEPTMPNRIDLTGQRFGLLTVTRHAGSDAAGRATWLCACDCGGEKVVKAAELKKGSTGSCGCLAKKQRQKAAQSQSHDYSRSKWPREYNAWEGMVRRCTDQSYDGFTNYGGRGIAVCERWMKSFRAFAEDMGRSPIGGTIERIDNAAGYYPENCRWASRKEQANNRRSNRLLTHGGRTLNVSQWAEELGIARATLYQRLHKGWPVDRVLSH